MLNSFFHSGEGATGQQVMHNNGDFSHACPRIFLGLDFETAKPVLPDYFFFFNHIYYIQAFG